MKIVRREQSVERQRLYRTQVLKQKIQIIKLKKVEHKDEACIVYSTVKRDKKVKKRPQPKLAVQSLFYLAGSNTNQSTKVKHGYTTSKHKSVINTSAYIYTVKIEGLL